MDWQMSESNERIQNTSDDTTKAKSKWTPRPLLFVCGVCDAPAADVWHYGSIACYSCRRSVDSEKELKVCVKKTNDCIVNQGNRTRCKRCRFEKCLQNGMKKENVRKSKGRKKKEIVTAKKDRKDVASNSKACSSNRTKVKMWNENVAGVKKPNLDIESLAEMCVLEEGMEQSTECKKAAKLTLEEEFRLYELDAMKESVQIGITELLFNTFPKVEERFSSLLSCLYLGLEDDILPGPTLLGQHLFRQFMIDDLANKGPLWTLFECFYPLKDIPEKVKMETFQFSLPNVELCYRAFFKANSDKQYLIEQKESSGFRTNNLMDIAERTIPNPRETLRSIDDFAITLFKSPWARRKSDEDFFKATLLTLGNLVKDDIKLGTLYATLVLITPEDEKNNRFMASVQREINLLLYRYLRRKYGDYEKASQAHLLFSG